MHDHAPATLLSVATVVPPNLITQSDAAAYARDGFADRFEGFGRLAKVFETSGITRRYAARPIDWYLTPLKWRERNEVYLDTAGDLFVEAAVKALRIAGRDAVEVDAVVTVSSTGIATPSLDARVSKRVGFRDDIERAPLFGLGCAGGVAGMSIAARLASSRPGALVLLVAVELCTLSFRLDKLTNANIVATALFGDGAAACLLQSGEDGVASIEMSGQHTWKDTLGIMGWEVDQEGLGVVFDRSIPRFAEAKVAAALDTILERGGLERGDVDRFACHPGGAKVIEALERALSLPTQSLSTERDVLAEFGNMSSPTALFVLERLIATGMPPRTLLTAMGPGFTTSCVSLTRPT